jgi:Mg2+/Co2+ transporter CorB
LSEDVPLGLLFGLLIVLLVLSAFFSSTETALMSLNRYRLRHRARSGHHAARLTEKLLERPDRLIGLILLGNNAVNLAAAALVTVIAIRVGGEAAIFAGTMILTVVVLIFAEVTPKTIAARHPSKLALPASLIYYPLLKVAYPLVWIVSMLANALLRLLGFGGQLDQDNALSEAELRTLVAESANMMPRRHQRMLLSILDLGDVTVDDVMVPRQEIVGVELIRNAGYSRLPVFRGDIDKIVGVVHLRSILSELASGTLNEPVLLAKTQEPYFVPEGTSLNKQLVNFQRLKQRLAFAVDEYGDIQGLVTTEDVIREIVGEFGTDAGPIGPEVSKERDDAFVVDASANIRQLNRLMSWELPTDGPKTLNGLIIEELETIPEAGTHLTLAGYPLEILDTTEHAIRRVRIEVPDPDAELPQLSALGG